jgi:metal-responsive CopG/Arc/MetJ family transcriptional regulator
MKIWECAFVRTTIELPDSLFREVKATAARQGMRLKDYVTEALQDKLAKRQTKAEQPWMKFAGIAANDPEMVAELKRIEQVVDETFGQIEAEEWK